MNYNLIYRLRALYKGSRYMSRILIAGASIEAISVFACGGWSIGALSFSSDGGCLPIVAQMASQLAICTLTSFKSLKLYLQSGWMEMPLLSLIARDGLAVFVLFMGLLTAMLWDVIHRQSESHTAQLCYFIFP
ncbi:hypothetical protein CVT25_012746 [Psilocybe cyanescens]|uniref:Uncharacterized protein n=1 Tax=Psilocybe cyanescens TaxID=93625 RepID=A0A409XSJ7_PSICY|nr:hypothetical protein CVT25_012746 [Psilocybe cyanescens]